MPEGTDCETILQCSIDCGPDVPCREECFDAGSRPAQGQFLDFQACAQQMDCSGWRACARACPEEAAACGLDPDQ
ncbi:hypothetical protein L6V77_17595 [Myxococcota bacterium]|nr:hypothetical protein [Myxococcota bacterium]